MKLQFSQAIYSVCSKYAESQGWRIEVLSENEGEHGGFKEVICRVDGDGVYGRLKFESGAHRVQRVQQLNHKVVCIRQLVQQQSCLKLTLILMLKLTRQICVLILTVRQVRVVSILTKPIRQSVLPPFQPVQWLSAKKNVHSIKQS